MRDSRWPLFSFSRSNPNAVEVECDRPFEQPNRPWSREDAQESAAACRSAGPVAKDGIMRATVALPGMRL